MLSFPRSLSFILRILLFFSWTARLLVRCQAFTITTLERRRRPAAQHPHDDGPRRRIERIQKQQQELLEKSHHFDCSLVCLHASGGDDDDSWSPFPNDNSDNDDGASSTFDWPVLQERLDRLRLDITEDESFRQPPNAHLNAYEFVSQLLHGLWHVDRPLPDAGVRRLLRAASPSWKRRLYRSVGAPLQSTSSNRRISEDVVAASLREAMARPNNQFALLLSSSSTEDDDDEEEEGSELTTTASRSRSRFSSEQSSSSSSATTSSNSISNNRPLHYRLEDDEPSQSSYQIVFPSEVLDYGDGTCWLECQLRRRTTTTATTTSSSTENNSIGTSNGSSTSELLVTTGWELVRRPSDQAWLVDRMDWQDFRDEFRPGIGREEWMRICG